MSEQSNTDLRQRLEDPTSLTENYNNAFRSLGQKTRFLRSVGNDYPLGMPQEDRNRLETHLSDLEQNVKHYVSILNRDGSNALVSEWSTSGRELFETEMQQFNQLLAKSQERMEQRERYRKDSMETDLRRCLENALTASDGSERITSWNEPETTEAVAIGRSGTKALKQLIALVRQRSHFLRRYCYDKLFGHEYEPELKRLYFAIKDKVHPGLDKDESRDLCLQLLVHIEILYIKIVDPDIRSKEVPVTVTLDNIYPGLNAEYQGKIVALYNGHDRLMEFSRQGIAESISTIRNLVPRLPRHDHLVMYSLFQI